MFDVVNPYQTPKVSTTAAWPVPSNPNLPIVATLTSRGWLYRHLRLGGGLEANLTWNARGPIETVRVNGKKASAKSPLWYVPHFSFDLDATSSSHHVEIDVRLYWLLPFVVKAIRVRIDGTVVYSEGKWLEHVRRVQRSPRPATPAHATPQQT